MNATGQDVDNGEKKELNGSADSPNYEALASELGWTPEEKFKGDKSRFVDAKTYYEKGSLVLPIVKQQRDEAKTRADKLEKQLAEVKTTMADFQKFTEAASQRKESELKAEIAALKEAKAKAVETGDSAAYRQAENAIDERTEALAEAKKAPVKVEAKETGDPDFESWVEENQWYKTDRKLKMRADVIGANLVAEDPNLKGKALFKAVSAEMERMEGELSGTERPGPQRGGKPSGSDSKKQTFDNMVPEAKAAFAKFEKQGIKMTKDQYVAKVGPEAWGA